MYARKIITGLIVVLLFLLTSSIYFHAYSFKYGFSKLITMGSHFFPRAIAEVRILPISIDSKFGYDGQFYAQMSVDPTLQNPGFNQALDKPVYRARRIFLPLCAHILGLGKPGLIIQVYSVINFFFWLFLVFLLLKFIPDRSYYSFLCLVAAALNTGVIASMQHALTDLPAASLCLAAMLVGSYRGAGILSLALLTREISVFALSGLLDFKSRQAGRENIILFFMTIVPVLIWCVYISLRFPENIVLSSLGSGNFCYPFVFMVKMLRENFSYVLTHWPHLATLRPIDFLSDYNVRYLFTILSVLTMIVYMITHRNKDSKIWRMGIAYVFVLLFATWGPAIDRLCMLLTLSFYILLAADRSKWFFPFFILSSLNLPYSIYALSRS